MKGLKICKVFISPFYKTIGALNTDVQDNTTTYFIFGFYQEGCYLMRIEYMLNKFTDSERNCFAFGSM
jgi:hypothetical protein